MASYKFRRGSTISLAVDAVSGDISSVTAVAAHLKTLEEGQARPTTNSKKVAEFQIASRTASGGNPAGWTLTLSANNSKSLKEGFYYVDLALTMSGATIITDGLRIEIQEPSTVLP